MFNIILLCVGSGACGFAAWALWEGGAAAEAEAGVDSVAAGRAGLAALAAWGGALALAALAGVWGAARGSAALLGGAAALLALTAAAEASAAVWGAAHLPRLRAALLQRLHHTVRHDYGVLPARTQLIDAIQQGLECCGANDMRDWQNSAWARMEEGSGTAAGGTPGALDLSVSADPQYYLVPPSCCLMPESEACGRSEGGSGSGSGVAGVARRVPAASGGGAGLHRASCGARVLGALQAGARAPLTAAGALLAAHALAALLALALALTATAQQHRYKA
ncbi:hypothetical protein evm_011703 [Chilo suppressalis]|nr:hypothetical protein evm_011703 [Chilo suppressalis]